MAEYLQRRRKKTESRSGSPIVQPVLCTEYMASNDVVVTGMAIGPGTASKLFSCAPGRPSSGGPGCSGDWPAAGKGLQNSFPQCWDVGPNRTHSARSPPTTFRVSPCSPQTLGCADSHWTYLCRYSPILVGPQQLASGPSGPLPQMANGSRFARLSPCLISFACLPCHPIDPSGGAILQLVLSPACRLSPVACRLRPSNKTFLASPHSAPLPAPARPLIAGLLARPPSLSHHGFAK